MTEYLPEGKIYAEKDNLKTIGSINLLEAARKSGRILEALCTVCDTRHDMSVRLGNIKGIIPREEGAIGISEGTTRDIAMISKVGKPVCFKVKSIEYLSGEPVVILSRRAAQEEAYENYISKLCAGDIIKAKVTHLEQFGCFADIGCGIPSMIPIDAISVSRISHPSDRFFVGEDIIACVKSNCEGRICLTHKELLGTWEENAALFCQGETVPGIIRSIESYGVFVELAPNLAGLAELRSGIKEGMAAGVYIKAIIPEKMKIKLIIVDAYDLPAEKKRPDYFISEGRIDKWVYSYKGAGKYIATDFTQ